jgi:hypothetical protein
MLGLNPVGAILIGIEVQMTAFIIWLDKKVFRHRLPWLCSIAFDRHIDTTAHLIDAADRRRYGDPKDYKPS